ncbi:MAG: hypothetical protein WCA35_23210, partial [Kovacikia sp.]
LRRWQRQLVPTTGLAALLTLTAGWLGGQAIVPAVVQAYTSRVEVALVVEPGESYETLMRRAEAVARAAAQRSFDRDLLITDVLVLITAQNETAITPILSLGATRTQWRSLPDPRRWATYYRSSRSLLGIGRIPSSPAASPPKSSTSPTIVTPGPASTPAQPTAPSPARSPNQPPANGPGTAPTSPSSEVPGSSQPSKTPILPDRILTPAGIGK